MVPVCVLLAVLKLWKISERNRAQGLRYWRRRGANGRGLGVGVRQAD